MNRRCAMGKKTLTLVAAGILVSTAALTWMSAREKEPSWAITADIAESCNCNPACPCVFGSPSTHDHCEGSRLVDIKKGHYGDVRLDGIPVVITFRMGGYIEYHVSDTASKQQVKAAEQLMDHTFPAMVEWGKLGTQVVPVSVERDGKQVRFTTPTATVDITLMEGLGGKPVQVHDLPAEFLTDYTQYVSEENSHKDEDHEFEYSGTNGFTSSLSTKG
jgi:hypothetical protein